MGPGVVSQSSPARWNARGDAKEDILNFMITHFNTAMALNTFREKLT